MTDHDYRGRLLQNMGPCCACLQPGTQANVLALPYRAPVPGTGWGCVVCELPADGAIAVLCDSCIEKGADPVCIVHGFVMDGGRVGVDDVEKIPHEHDQEVHKRDEARIAAWEAQRHVHH